MKRFTGLFIVAIIASTLTIPSASAKMGGKKGVMMNNMTEHHQMMQDMMGMMKETMAVLKDLNHSPTAEQKTRLDEMINKMDGFMKKHEEMMKEKQEKMEKKQERMK